MSAPVANAEWSSVPRLQGRHVRLEPLQPAHVSALRAALGDGALSRCWYTNVPAPEDVEAYVASALDRQAQDDFYASKLGTARFYFARLLPRIESLSAAVKAGSESLYLLDAAQF